MTTETNGEEKGTVLDAINEALGLGGEDEQSTGAGDVDTENSDDLLEAGDDQSTDDGAGEVDSGDEQGGDEAGGDKPAGEGAEVTQGTDKSGVQPAYADLVKEATKLGIQQRNADGTIKSGEKLAAEIATKKGGDGKQQGDPAAAKKQPDALNDPIPKDLKAETQQRIRTLIDRTKGAEEKAQQATQNFDFMVNGLKAVGATPEQYGETLSFLALFNSGDMKQQGQALDILEDMADKLATLLGRERKSSDPLERHADLIAAVQKKEITPQLAREMARQRNQGSFQQELRTAATTTQQQEQQAQQELNGARQELNDLEQQLKASDPLYARKRAAIVPALKATFKHIRPSQWKAAFEEAYKSVRVAPIQKTAGTPKQQPMRAGKNPAGSGANANGGTGGNTGGPASMLEAVNAALARR